MSIRQNGVTEEVIIQFKKITDEMNATYAKAFKNCDEIPMLEICQKCKFNYSNGGCDYCKMEDICKSCERWFRLEEDKLYCPDEDAYYCEECYEELRDEYETDSD